jgi:hypothetical protein
MLHAAPPTRHDDHGGRAVRHAAHRAGIRRRRTGAPTKALLCRRPRRGWLHDRRGIEGRGLADDIEGVRRGLRNHRRSKGSYARIRPLRGLPGERARSSGFGTTSANRISDSLKALQARFPFAGSQSPALPRKNGANLFRGTGIGTLRIHDSSILSWVRPRDLISSGPPCRRFGQPFADGDVSLSTSPGDPGKK